MGKYIRINEAEILKLKNEKILNKKFRWNGVFWSVQIESGPFAYEKDLINKALKLSMAFF